MAESWLVRQRRLEQEQGVSELRKRGELSRVKAIATPEMHKRIQNAERRLKRKEK